MLRGLRQRRPSSGKSVIARGEIELRFRSSISPPGITDFPLDGLRCLSPRNMTRILSSLAVRLSGCGPQTATPKAIRRHVRGGIASLVICWYETGGSAASTDTWRNLLSSFRQSLALLLNLSSRPVTQMPNIVLAPRLNSHVHAGRMEAYQSF